MSTVTKQTHTPGALRAAQRVMRELRNDARSPMAYSLADAISRETGDTEMLAALERVDRWLVKLREDIWLDKVSPEQQRERLEGMRVEIEAAIRKAKGEL